MTPEQIAAIQAETLERAAKAAEGPVFCVNPKTGEASIRGTENSNWSVPQPIAEHSAGSYGQARTDAAAAIRALKLPTDWVVVPREPSDAMTMAGFAAYSTFLGSKAEAVIEIYRAMLNSEKE